MFNISLKGYSTQKGVSGGASVFKIRPCYGKKSSVNENRISYLQIDETVSTGLNNHRGGAPNTKQTEIMVRNNFLKPLFCQFNPHNISNFGSYFVTRWIYR